MEHLTTFTEKLLHYLDIKRKRTPTIILLISCCFIGILISITIICILSSAFGGKVIQLPTPDTPHRIIENTLTWNETWRKNNLHISPHDPPNITATDGEVIFGTRPSINANININSLNAFTGKLQWEVQGLFDVYGLISNKDGIFIAIPYTMDKYELLTGNHIWKTKIFSTNKIYKLSVDNSKILAYLQEYSDFRWVQYVYSIDTETGYLTEILQKKVSPDTILLLNTNVFDYWAINNSLSALKHSTDEVLWSSSIEDPTFCLPTTTGSIIVQSGNILTTLSSLNNKDGSVLWQYNTPIISNIILVENSIYAITNNMEIVEIDINSGLEKGHIQFSRNSAIEDSFETAYYIANTQDIFIVYLGDSQELIAFQNK